MSMEDSLKASKPAFDLASLIKSARAQGDGEGVLPVERWNPDYCGEMDMVIKKDGSWWHEGTRICLLYTSPSPRDATLSRMPSSA